MTKILTIEDWKKSLSETDARFEAIRIKALEESNLDPFFKERWRLTFRPFSVIIRR